MSPRRRVRSRMSCVDSLLRVVLARQHVPDEGFQLSDRSSSGNKQLDKLFISQRKEEVLLEREEGGRNVSHTA